jgi:hypothetical protein
LSQIPPWRLFRFQDGRNTKAAGNSRGFLLFLCNRNQQKNDAAWVSFDEGIGLAGRAFACMRMPFRATNSTQVLFV